MIEITFVRKNPVRYLTTSPLPRLSIKERKRDWELQCRDCLAREVLLMRIAQVVVNCGNASGATEDERSLYVVGGARALFSRRDKIGAAKNSAGTLSTIPRSESIPARLPKIYDNLS